MVRAVTGEAFATWAGVGVVIVTQLVATGYTYGRLLGRLRLLEYRLGQVEFALKRLGFPFTADSRDASV